MLDPEQNPTVPVDDGLPKPPAGRRSRRRPAGPPAEPVAGEAAVADSLPDLASQPVEEAPVAEPEALEAVTEPEAPGEESEPIEEPDVEEPDVEANELIEIEAVATHADEAATDQPDDEAEATHSAAGAEDEEEEEGDEGQQSTQPRRRRRRRGGRRRHTGEGLQSAAGDEDEEGAEAEVPAVEEPTAEQGTAPEKIAGAGQPAEEFEEESDDRAEGEGGSSASSRRRRRRRRRRGEDASTGAEDDPTDVVVKVREPHAAAEDQIRAVEGSTRLEAKRQRRREGRAAGRRRAPIASESEFLARRESVRRQMVLRQGEEYSQIAVLEDGVLVEHYVDRESSSSLIGNIYLGKVQNVLPSMEAAFIDIGRGRNAVLYAGEVDWDAYGAPNSDRRIERVLKSGQTVVVQVTKDPVGAKGARLTNHVSIPGRYVVYAPGGHLSGISRKLPDVERKRLKHILAELIEEGASVIVRTAAEGATQEQLVHDVTRLKSQWDAIEKKAKHAAAPQLLYSEPDLTIRTVRDLFTEDFAELVIDGNGEDNDAYETLADYLEHVAPHLRERVVHWDHESRGDVFAHYRLDEQIAKALERKVHLPSGGSLVIDRTEAMTVIDVNTGKFTGYGGNLEATVTANNLEAAEEVVRQLRLRDIGGIIVVDFIDMVLPSNRELLLRRLVECLGRDRTRHQVSEVTSLGLVQMTRKKIGTGLAEAFTEPCEVCNNRGYLIHDMPVATQAPADGGDRQGRNSRKRSRGKASTTSTQTTAAPASVREPEGELVSVESRAAAQAAMNAVAHAGTKLPSDEAEGAEERTAVAVVPEGRTEEQPETATTGSRSRRSSRSRGSRRPAGAPGVETAEPAEAAVEAVRVPAAEEAEPTGGPSETKAEALAELVAALAGDGTEAPALIEATADEVPADEVPADEARAAKKATTRKTAAKKTAASKTAASKTAKKAPARKSTTRKTTATKATLPVEADPVAGSTAPVESVTGDAPVVDLAPGEGAEASVAAPAARTARKSTRRTTTKAASGTGTRSRTRKTAAAAPADAEGAVTEAVQDAFVPAPTPPESSVEPSTDGSAD